MKREIRTLIIVFIIITLTFTMGIVETKENIGTLKSQRERLSMDYDWRFHLGDTSDITRDFGFGASRTFAKTGSGRRRSLTVLWADFDDSNWRMIDLPHDWVVELDFDPRADRSHGFKKVGRQWPLNTIGWYRKTFELPESDEGKKLSIEFDGVYRDSMAWLNGHFLGRNMSGYTSFSYDISDYANYGGKNVLVVRVDASYFEGWFYEGAGIYRHVWLVKTDPLHIAHWGTFVSSTVKSEAGGLIAEVTVKTKIANEYDRDSTCILVSSIINTDGKTVTEAQSEEVTINARGNSEITLRLTVRNPNLWSVDSPYLYRLVQNVKKNDTIIDINDTIFGIRTVRFDADKGFFLNGNPLKL